MDPQALKQQLVKDLDIESLPEVLQDEIIEGLGQNVMKRVTLEILKKIPEDKRDEFESISEKGDQEQARAFIGQYIPNLDEFTAQVTTKEVNEYKELVEKKLAK